MHELALFFLGNPIVEYNGTAVKLSTRKATALLAHLAVTQTAQRRETLLALLWPELDRTRGLAALRTTLSAIRKALAGEWLIADGGAVRLADGYACDLHLFEQEMALAQPAETAVSRKIIHLQNALALARGEFLAGFTLADSAAFDEWQFQQTEFWRQQTAAALRDLCALLAQQEEIETAVTYARQWAALDPLHEPAQRCLIDLYLRSGQRSAALRQYEQFKQRLADELDVSPEPETTALLSQTPSDPSVSPHTQLPANQSLLPFVGRTAELAKIDDWLADENGRLLTIAGIGGMGKSRLAMEAARAGKRPSVFVPLAAISDPARIVSAIAQALNFSFYGQGSPQAQLIDFLRSKTMLLVLDNFEQLLAGAPQLTEILNQAPGVKMLVTSREQLRLRGEWVLELHGLPTQPAQQAPSDAVRLFSEVAQRLRPSFNLDAELDAVTHICRLVDGMPLGIELAAAWVRTLPCADIGAQIEKNLDFLATTLQDVPARQRSLRAVFDQSWRLLTSDAQRLFRQCAVFRGGFSPAAATAVLPNSLPALRALIDQSLLHQDENGRFQMPAALLAYAQEKLDAHSAEKAAVLAAHSRYFANWLSAFTTPLRGGGQKEALTAIQAELENVTAAWRRAVSVRDEATLQAMIPPLLHFCEMRNLFQDAVDLFTLLPPAKGEDAPSRTAVAAQLRLGHFLHRLGRQTEAADNLQAALRRAAALQANEEIAFARNSLGYVAWSAAAYEEAEVHYRESLRLYRQLGDQWGVSQALNNLAILPQNRPEMKQMLEESVAIARQMGDLWSEARTLNNLGIVVADRRESTALYQRCLAICRDIDNQFLMTFPLINLGHTARMAGDFEEARAYYRESLTICGDIGYRAGAARSLGQLGAAAYHLGQYEQARRTCEDGLTMSAAIDDQRGVGLGQYMLGMIARAMDAAALARQRFTESLATFRQAKDPHGEAWPLLGLARLAVDAESWAAANASATEAFAIFEAIADHTGLALAAALRGAASRSATEARRWLKEGAETAAALDSPPLQMELKLLAAIDASRRGRLREAYQMVLVVERETAVSAPVRAQAVRIKNKIAPLLAQE